MQKKKYNSNKFYNFSEFSTLLKELEEQIIFFNREFLKKIEEDSNFEIIKEKISGHILNEKIAANEMRALDSAVKFFYAAAFAEIKNVEDIKQGKCHPR